MVDKKTRKFHKTTGVRRYGKAKNQASRPKRSVLPGFISRFFVRIKSSIGWAIKWCFVAGLWAGFFIIGALAFLAADLPDIESAVDFDKRPKVILLAANGDEIARYGDLQGEIVPSGKISKNLVNAVMAIEDRRFYHHFGIDPIGLFRAMATNMISGRVVQGGSTVTQQLAKMLFLTPERKLSRKVKEALLALYLEYKYSKDEIMSAYLNRAYFGAGAYGVDAAAEIYFGKTPDALSVEEGAMLAGLLRAPSRYSPANSPEKAAARTQVVLRAMADAGYIPESTAKIPVKPMEAKEYSRAGAGDMRYFGDWVMEQIGAYIGSINQDLIVQTTVIPELQKAAGDRVRAYVDTNRKEWNLSQGALLTMEKDGAVRALIGGREYQESQYNRVTEAKRQPGSSFKPFVYLTALQNGYSPLTMVEDKPVRYGSYAPQNYKNEYKGTLPLMQALNYSLNTVAVQLVYNLGVSKVIETARRMGITDDLPEDLSLALGTGDMSLMTLVTAYVPFANGGYSVQPYGFTEIRTASDGKLIYQREQYEPTRVIDPRSLYAINIMLQGTVEHGTGKAAQLARPAAGKTGTTQGFKDAWFIGYTANYITGVWMGNDNNDPMKGVTGGLMPARIWHDYMMQAQEGLPVTPLLGSDVVNDYFANNDFAKDNWAGQSRVLPGMNDMNGPAMPSSSELGKGTENAGSPGSGFWGLLGSLTGGNEPEHNNGYPSDR